jgi:hypothetical protein
VITSGIQTQIVTPTVKVQDYSKWIDIPLLLLQKLSLVLNLRIHIFNTNSKRMLTNIATTETSTITWGVSTVYATTITKTTTSYTVASSIKTIKTACEPTYTTTYAAKCAPTNLVRAINNVGLVSGEYADGTAVSYGPNDDEDQYHHDPSLCCQLCQDNKGCGASMWGPGPGACGLYYTPANATVGGAECGEFVLNYQSEEGVLAGQSLILQSGCGLIEYAGHHVPK